MGRPLPYAAFVRERLVVFDLPLDLVAALAPVLDPVSWMLFSKTETRSIIFVGCFFRRFDGSGFSGCWIFSSITRSRA